jgi:hypothetical protein
MQFLHEWEAVRAKRPDAESRLQAWDDDDEGAYPSFRCADEQHCCEGFKQAVTLRAQGSRESGLLFRQSVRNSQREREREREKES